MSQNTLVIADGTGAQVLSRMNNAYNTLATLNSGSTAPTTTYAYMLWADTTNNLLKMRNAANTGWNTVGSFDASSFLATSVVDGSISEAKIATGAVTVNKIGALAVTDAKLADNSVTTAKILDANVTPAKLSQPLTRETAKTTTTGTTCDFTNIPSWAKRITVMFNNVSTTGSSILLLQLCYGTTSIQTTGYTGTYDDFSSAPSAAAITQTGFPITGTRSAPSATHGTLTLSLLGSNTWCISSSLAPNPGRLSYCHGSVNVAGTVDRIRITTVNGTDTFDLGSINIMYE